ncbi:leader peptidase (prepilin peptidase) / N-methyltransferase [Klenkia marina]|uniref:Leader peptidase (Prepilin peptidase) / N-methyltransferase n=1 Tax=Klenkia marina TaxID=1960309 RepID=A0A1G4YBK7_9ACTN|nr:prepilin peptidase [Klenkia marina]SCX50782.1 leader peptidase (prepilin peptidase) / N-methyltransferase [Klenkia marina]
MLPLAALPTAVLPLAAGLLGAALGPWLARATVRLATRDRTAGAGRVRTLVTTVLTAALLAGGAALVGPRPALGGVLWLAAAGVVLAGVDLATHRLPDVVTLPALAVLVAATAVDALVTGDGARALHGVLLGAAAFGVAAALRLAAPAGLGFGDVKLLAPLGVLLGWVGGGTLVVVGVFLGLVVGAVASLVLLATGRAGWRSAVPFGPPLLAGAALACALAPGLTGPL